MPNFMMPRMAGQKFCWKSKLFWLVLSLFLGVRLFLAAKFPMTNDEVYYWDWSRDLQLSYMDAPPMVAWLSAAGSFFLKNSLGARLFVPFVHILCIIFLIKSVEVFAALKNTFVSYEHVFFVLLFMQIAPVFHLEGFLLLPDISLLLGISAALYFLLKYVVYEKFTALPFGFFLGIAALSKYHALPIAVGFFLATISIKKNSSLGKDGVFFLTAAFIALLVSSPVFIWNMQNHYASFVFQSAHGYSNLSINFKAFFRYLIGVLFYLLPWFCIPLFLFAIKNVFGKYERLCTFPFFFIFILILFSALGKQALPHWVMPGFFLLIPPFVLSWKPLEEKRKKLWKSLFIFSTALSVLLPILISLESVQQFVTKAFVFFTGNADPLVQALLWQNLERELNKQQHIKLQTKEYSTNYCQANSHVYEIASLRWYWSSQLAFYLQHQPRIFNFDNNNQSFYTWRDGELSQLSGCHFVIIGSQDHYNEEALKKIMYIEKVKKFSLAPFNGEKIVYVEGVIN